MNAHELSLRLADRAQSVCEYLLPNGKKKGNEWKCGNVHGGAGDSLSVRVSGEKKGVWSDFSAGIGGDLLDLWANCRGISISAALPQVREYLGVSEVPLERARTLFKRPNGKGCTKPSAEVFSWLKTRLINSETSEAFKVSEKKEGNRTLIALPYLLADGTVMNIKTRDIADKKYMRQEAGAEPCLFGWHLIPLNLRKVCITEGEFDAMVLHQMGFHALSVNAGAGNHQWIESDWERLQQFSEILVCFDDDEAGRKGAKEVINRLGVDRCKLVRFAHKDANDALLAGYTTGDFNEDMECGKYLSPDELVSAGSFTGQILNLFMPAEEEQRNAVLKFSGREYKWFEFRPGEVTVWTGISGHGKSLMLGQVLLGCMQQGEKACIYSGEMPAARTIHRMVKQATAVDKPTPDYIRGCMDWLNDMLWIFNIRGTANLERLLEVFGYAAKRYGVRHVVIDSLMMLADVPEDGAGALTAQKEAMRKIVAFAEQHGVHAHLVAHPRKARDESQAPGKMDISGSSKITDAACNVFAVWSARKEPDAPLDDTPDAKLELHKQRNGEEQHRSLYLFYERKSQQFCTFADRKVSPYFKWAEKETVNEYI